MPSPTSLKAKGKQKVTDDDALTVGDFEDATDSGSSSGSSDSGSDRDPDSDSNSVSDLGSSSKPEADANEGPPLSRDDLLVYLENMRRRFSKTPTTDSFADQEEEVFIVTSENK
jgi:hypothetical protein